MTDVNDWVHNLPLAWMALLIFGGTYLLTAAIYYIVTAVAVGEGPRILNLCRQVYCHRLVFFSVFSLRSRLPKSVAIINRRVPQSNVRLAH